MNILVIGNGFDLAHGLPTKYTDFLDWIIDQTYFYEYLKKEGAEIVKNISSLRVDIPKAKRRENLSQRVPHQKEIWECIDNNVWIDYFLQNSMYQRENWIDFEREISKVIQSVDADMRENDFDSQIIELSNEFLMKKYRCCKISTDALFIEEGKEEDTRLKLSYHELRDILYNDLNRLIRALEIYLCEYVGKIEIKKKSPDIESLEIGEVLSFNYTDTFTKLYKVATGIEEDDTDPFDYIHGKADSNNTIESNNMVLGIDEYLPDDRRNKDIDFIAFKKFYQRIYNETGCKYKKWIDQIILGWKENDANKRRDYSLQTPYGRIPDRCKNKLFIFGHSLDITDGDILKELILKDNVYTTIFYHNKETMGQQLANLVKIIGQDELIRRTGGITKTIEFKRQQDMVEVI